MKEVASLLDFVSTGGDRKIKNLLKDVAAGG
jgi:hypothetical protein